MSYYVYRSLNIRLSSGSVGLVCETRRALHPKLLPTYQDLPLTLSTPTHSPQTLVRKPKGAVNMALYIFASALCGFEGLQS